MGHAGLQRYLLHPVAIVCQVARGHLSVLQRTAQGFGGGRVDVRSEPLAALHHGQDCPSALAGVPDCGGGHPHGHCWGGRPANGVLRGRVGGCEQADKERGEEDDEEVIIMRHGEGDGAVETRCSTSPRILPFYDFHFMEKLYLCRRFPHCCKTEWGRLKEK